MAKKEVPLIIEKYLGKRKAKAGEWSADEVALVELLDSGGFHGVKEVSSSLDKSTAGIIELAQSVNEKGIAIWHEKGEDSLLLAGSTTELSPEGLVIKDNEVRIGFIADTLLGSKYQQLGCLYRAFQIAEREGVDFMIHLGVSAGRPSSGQYDDFFLPTVEEQAEYIARNYPRSDKFKTRIIGGYHDAKWGKDNVLAMACQMREDLIYRGFFQSDFPLRRGVENGARWPILRVAYRGGDNSPYSKSYPVQGYEENLIQNVAELFEDGKPDIGVVAGQGVFLTLPGESVKSLFSIPGLRTVSPSILRKKNKAVTPTVGFVILTVKFDNNGDFSFKTHCCPLKSVKNDYKVKFSDNKEEVEKLTLDERKILGLLEESPRTAGELTQAINKSEETIIDIILKLRSYDYEISESDESKNFKLKPVHKSSFDPKPINFNEYFYETVECGAVSDTHIGSSADLIPILDEAYDLFKKRGITDVDHVGDLFNGPSKHGEHMKGENYEDRATPLVKLAAIKYPKRDGIKTHMIMGNHDGWFRDLAGLDIGEYFACKRQEDIDYLGICEGFRRAGKAFIFLKHYDWGTGVARSYKPQGVVETQLKEVSKEPERYRGKTIVILSGGGHVYSAMLLKGIVFILMPCLQGKTSFVNRMGKISDVGFIIYSITYSKNGELTRFGIEYFDRVAVARKLERKRDAVSKRCRSASKSKKVVESPKEK